MTDANANLKAWPGASKMGRHERSSTCVVDREEGMTIAQSVVHRTNLLFGKRGLSSYPITRIIDASCFLELTQAEILENTFFLTYGQTPCPARVSMLTKSRSYQKSTLKIDCNYQ
jgi:hypothetical protein